LKETRHQRIRGKLVDSQGNGSVVAD